MVTTEALFLSVGYPVMSQGEGSRVSNDSHCKFSFPALFQSMPRRSRLKLLGNAQHMSDTGRFVLFILSNLIRRRDLEAMYDFQGRNVLPVLPDAAISIQDSDSDEAEDVHDVDSDSDLGPDDSDLGPDDTARVMGA